jgi:hypothetical protein
VGCLCGIGEIVILVFGIIATVTGKVSLSRSRVCQGAAARVVGVILIITPVLAFGIPVTMGAVKGFQMGAQGKTELNAEEMKSLGE